MDKYKLIKEYPGSPKLGTIIDIVNNSEFWEKIEEKEYEILEVHHINSNFKLPFSDIMNSYLQEFEIISVKRLSDGEIFSIGDYINKNFIINYFSLCCGKIIAFEKINNNGERSLSLSKLNKTIKLFTTEDGVDIFKGDIYSFVNIINLTCHKNIMATGNCKEDYSYSYTKYFSKPENAKEYILMNKACLSINDIKKALNNNGLEFFELNKLIEIVKNNSVGI